MTLSPLLITALDEYMNAVRTASIHTMQAMRSGDPEDQGAATAALEAEEVSREMLEIVITSEQAEAALKILNTWPHGRPQDVGI